MPSQCRDRVSGKGSLLLLHLVSLGHAGRLTYHHPRVRYFTYHDERLSIYRLVHPIGKWRHVTSSSAHIFSVEFEE